MRVTFSCSAPYSCSKEEMLEKMTDLVMNMDTSAQRQNIILQTDEDAVRAHLFFVDTPIIFDCTGGRLTITVDSTMTGPGYHANMVGMMDYVSDSLELQWEPESIQDVTGYWHERDFAKLQDHFTAGLIDYAKRLTEDPNLTTPVMTSLTMPHATQPVGDQFFACHSLGYIHKDFFIYIQMFSEPELFSRAFFIWWDMELDAEFYLKCALNVIWCRLNWLPPVLEEEMLDITNVLLELEIAWQMDNSLPLPVAEWIEIAKLIWDQDLADELIRRFPTEINQPPSKGYRRHDILHVLGDHNWTIRLPGKMHTSHDMDGSLVFWDHDDRNIRITVASRRDEDGNMMPPLELLSRAMTGMNVSPHLLPGYVNVPAFVSHSEVDEDGKIIYKTTLFAATEGSMVVISIYYANKAEKQWALSICNSLAPTRPEALLGPTY